MFFFFIMGSEKFRKKMDEYDGRRFQCRNCGNWQAYCEKSWRWFTLCWIPIIPFSLGWKKDVTCPVCRVTEPLSHRTDITGAAHANQNDLEGQHQGGMMGGGGGGGGGYGGAPPPPPQQQPAGAAGYYKQ